jgi:hypothetical protein
MRTLNQPGESVPRYRNEHTPTICGHSTAVQYRLSFGRLSGVGTASAGVFCGFQQIGTEVPTRIGGSGGRTDIKAPASSILTPTGDNIMPRGHRKPLFDTSNLELLKPHDMPRDLLDLGWRFRSPTCADRPGVDGCYEAWVCADELVPTGKRGYDVKWTGGSMCPQRQLIDSFSDALTAIYHVEGAEARGPFSASWRGQTGAPEFDCWTHIVRKKRDVWHCRTSDNRQVFIHQTRADPWSLDTRYRVWIAGQYIIRDGEIEEFTNPRDAIRCAEYAA